jgi:hypothetical protein
MMMKIDAWNVINKNGKLTVINAVTGKLGSRGLLEKAEATMMRYLASLGLMDSRDFIRRRKP